MRPPNQLVASTGRDNPEVRPPIGRPPDDHRPGTQLFPLFPSSSPTRQNFDSLFLRRKNALVTINDWKQISLYTTIRMEGKDFAHFTFVLRNFYL
jgi:hypothetical protein